MSKCVSILVKSVSEKAGDGAKLAASASNAHAA